MVNEGSQCSLIYPSNVCLQRLLFARVRRCISSQHYNEAQEASGSYDGVVQSHRPLRQRRLLHGGAAAVPASVHVHRLRGRRLARQTAVRAATSRNGSRRMYRAGTFWRRWCGVVVIVIMSSFTDDVETAENCSQCSDDSEDSHLKPGFHPNAIACVACVVLAFSPVSIQTQRTQRTQRKRLRLNGNRAWVCSAGSPTFDANVALRSRFYPAFLYLSGNNLTILPMTALQSG